MVACAYAGMSKELGNDRPFVTLSAPEVYCMDVGQTEVLTQAIRRAIAVNIHEENEVCSHVFSIL